MHIIRIHVAAARKGGGFLSASAFTLVEILVVVLLIGLLMTFATRGVLKARNTAIIKDAEKELVMIAAAVETLAWDTGCWPGGQHQRITKKLDDSGVGREITDLTASDSGLLEAGDYPNWRGPYLTQIPVDPWGTPYWFDPDYTTANGSIAAVGSSGPNKSGKNVYDSDNIYVDLTYIHTRTE